MIRGALTLVFWAVATTLGALVMFPYTLLSGNIMPIYRVGMWVAWTGVRIAGVRVEVAGLDRLDPNGTYIFMSNHTSTLDPPILIPLIPKRTSVLVKKELFKIPVLGQAMHMGELVPVDRSNRERAVESVREAEKVLASGISMTIFAEGTRSRDGRLLPLKKGPFHMAIATGKPIVPVTIVGTHELQPKGKMVSRPGTVRVVFHDPIDSAAYGERRDELMATVRERIAAALPEHLRDVTV